ncbi:universal stress protein [Marinobacterium jannaschii]|uniref:universal stress protein n=1 Tax=Marinobacterium jannaschii TaxID=64970 RepID=UPI000489B2FF|nr:universal stress protein [Marinobacterium jannaschii]
MQRFKNILYFADGEQQLSRAFNRALNLARSNGARLCVFDVVADTAIKADIKQRLGLNLNEALREVRQKTLSSLIAPRIQDGDRVSIEVVNGVDFVEAIRAVLRDGYDLVIKAGRSPNGFSELILGSTDMHLLRKCPCPVWVDRPNQPPTYHNILAAVDPETPEGHDCAVKTLTLAASMAARENARLTVVHAWQLYGESTLESGFSRVSREQLEALLIDTEQQHQGMLNDLMAECGLADAGHEVHLIKGPPAESIRKVCAQNGTDLIVMGTVGRCGIPGFIIGNTAENVLQTTEASILAVKPGAFLSPVTVAE